MLTITAYGRPMPQGSKRLGRTRNGRPLIIEDNPNTRPWRAVVTDAAIRAMTDAGRDTPLDGPLAVQLTFTMPKPLSAPKRRRTYPTTKPDIDKLSRAALDALTAAGAIADDARIIGLVAVKVYPNEHERALPMPGLKIVVAEIDTDAPATPASLTHAA